MTLFLDAGSITDIGIERFLNDREKAQAAR